MHEESLKLGRSRIALNLVSPNKTMRFFLPQDKRSRNVRKRFDAFHAYCYPLYTGKRSSSQPFSVKGTVKRLFSPRKRNVFCISPSQEEAFECEQLQSGNRTEFGRENH